MTMSLPLSGPARVAEERAGGARAPSCPAEARRWLPVAGFRVRSTRADRLVRFLRGRLDRGEKIAVGFVNHHFVTAGRALTRGGCTDSSLLLVNDGVGMQLAARLRFGRGFRENLNGTDFVPRFLRQVGRPLTVYLVGGEQRVVRRAAAFIAALPNCRVVGFCDGYSLWAREAEVLRDMQEMSPDVLLVGLGNPKQERWVTDHWDLIEARIIFGVGALFEWMTGTRRRAPLIIQRLRCEWIYRLALEPRRLFHRYTVGVVHFFGLVFSHQAALVEPEARP